MTDENKTIAESSSPADERRAQLAALVPEAFSEGKVDVAALKRALGEEAIIEGGERYALTWAGKANAYKVLQTPSTATLRPERDKSVNFDEAQHVFIEGENLEVLKVLQKAYFGKVKLIYIDPPYNTGSDSFIYPDRFQESKEDYLRRINELSDDGTLMREGFFRKNSKENGHYHSNWLSMMLPRLYIARNLLREDGVIFVSCDDNEAHNLRLLMNEVFGEENYRATLQVRVRYEGKTLVEDSDFQKLTESVLIFSRGQYFEFVKIEEEYDLDKFIYRFEELIKTPKKIELGNKAVEVFPEGSYRIVKEVPSNDGLKEIWASGKVLDGNSSGRFFRDYLSGRVASDGLGVAYKVYGIGDDGLGFRYFTGPKRDGATKGKYFQGVPLDRRNADTLGTKSAPISTFYDFADAFGNCRLEGGVDFRAGKKPIAFLKTLIALAVDNAEKVLAIDFFAGSCSFAHACIDHSESTASVKTISVQLPEPLPSDHTYGKDINNIADISRVRLRNVFRDIAERSDLLTDRSLPVGFKSFLLTPSNFKQWRGDGIDTPEQLAEQMQMFTKSEKEGVQVKDMLYELLLKFGQKLTTPVETLEVVGGKVFAIHDRKMLFVLEAFTEAMVQPLVDMKPREIIAIDGVFHDSDTLKTNLDLQCRDAGIRFTCL